MPSLPTGTVTFLFTDIEGSTRLLQQLGDRYADALVAHHRLLRTAIQESYGNEMDAQGDALFVAFPSRQGCSAGSRGSAAGRAGASVAGGDCPAGAHGSPHR